MREGWHHHAVAVAVIGLLLGLHYWWRWQGVPLVAWSLALPLFIASTYRNSLLLLVIFIGTGEMLSFLPPGVMTIMTTLPYLTGRFLVGGVRLWSGRLWSTIAVTSALQLLINLLGYLWGEGLLMSALQVEWWVFIPWWHLGAQWLVSTTVVAMAVGAWHEASPSVSAYAVAK